MKLTKRSISYKIEVVKNTTAAVVAALPVLPAVYKAAKKQAPKLLKYARKTLKKK